MRIQLLFLFILTAIIGQSQTTYQDSIETHREEHTMSLFDVSQGVLNDEDLKHLKKVDYFEVDKNFKVEAKWTKNKGKRFKMPTSTERTPIYRRHGFIEFIINDSTYTLTVYRNMGLKKKKEFKNYFFIPFRDGTSGITSYGGGRYLDLYLFGKEDVVVIDFNLNYNPYCAYSHRYSCPIPPEENTLEVKIPAGEKTPIYID